MSATVLGLGLTCAAGLRTRYAAAAIRAGLARFRESTHYDRRGQPIVLASVPDDRLPALPAVGQNLYELRLTRLALAAAHEALAPLAKTATQALPKLPVALGLPSPPPPLSSRIRPDALAHNLFTALDRSIDLQRSTVVCEGRASGLLALAAAHALIAQGAPWALALAADSFDEPELLSTLDRDDRLRADGVYDGFIPGEAGAAVLLAAPDHAARSPHRAWAHLAGIARADEPGHRYSPEPHRGDGLAAAIRELLRAHPTTPIQSVFAGLNGESLFAKEWGVAAIRNHDLLAEHCRLEHPADCIGDTGAASGLLLTALAAHDLHTHPGSGPTLVWTAADHAPRTAALLQAAA